MRIPYHILGKSFYSHQPSFLLLCIFNFALNLYTSNSATLKNVTLKTLHIWWSPQEKKQLFFRKGFDFLLTNTWKAYKNQSLLAPTNRSALEELSLNYPGHYENISGKKGGKVQEWDSLDLCQKNHSTVSFATISTALYIRKGNRYSQQVM